MKRQISYFNKLFSVALFCFGLVPNSGAQGIEDLKALCDNVTQSNKAIALQAGYDLDELCDEIITSTPAKEVIQAPAPPAVTRGTASSSQEVSDKVAPVAVTGSGYGAPASSLKPFGYDLFANAPTTFAPASSVPVSGDYLLGPGDTLDILFYGKINNSFSLDINREGFVDFPELGPVGLAGLTYAEAKEMLQSRISAQIIGTQVSISMGSLRSIQIFVLGEAFKPGAYTISSLSTLTHALISSGGVSNIGSLRNIQLKRDGELIEILDLYDLLLKGDMSKDVRVQAADVIYIPTVGDLVSIEGQVLRPAIYEIKGGDTVGDLIRLAGGLGPKAFPASSRLERIDGDGFIRVFDLNLEQSSDDDIALRAGDHLSVDAITDFKKDIITLSGAVRHEGEFSWREGMRVSDIIPDRSKLTPDTDLEVSLLIRELRDSSDIEVFSFSVDTILQDSSSLDNFNLESRDEILILSNYEDRAASVARIVENLRRQASVDNLPKIVSAGGTVRFPGEYPLVSGMTIEKLIAFAGGLTEYAYSQAAEVFRMDLSNPERASSSIFLSDLTNVDSLKLESGDYIEFRTVPEYRAVETITLEGEFVFPGTYVFQRGETLSSVIDRAGGFLESAFLEGSVFLRESLREREQAELDRLINVLNDDIVINQLRDVNSGIVGNEDKVSAQLSVFDSLTESIATGRLVIPLADIMSNRSQDVELKDNDRLIIPKASQEVTILGEVRRPTSYLFDPNFSKSDYIELSGGFKDSADERGIYIVKASGKVIMNESRLFKFKSWENSLSAGDTIVVPLDTDDTRIKGLPLISEISNIIFELALGAAAVKSFSGSGN